MSGYFTLSQLRTPPTEEEAIAELKNLLSGSGFVVDDWTEGTFQLTVLRLAASLYNTMAERASTISKMTFNETSEGDWLTEFSKSHYDNTRLDAKHVRGYVTASLEAGTGPYTWDVGQLVVADETHKYIYRNVDVASVSTVTSPLIEFECDVADVGAQIDGNKNFDLVTQFNGLTLTTVVKPGTTSDWYTTQDANDGESDDALKFRNRAKWTTLGTGEMVSDRVALLALNAASGSISQVYVDDTNPRGAGTVDVYVANDYNVGTGADLMISGTLERAFFNGHDRIQVKHATPKVLNLTGTVYYRSVYTLTDITAKVEAAANEWLTSIPLGGNDYSPGPSNIASINDLVAAIENVDGVRKVTFTDYTDIDLSGHKKLVKSGAKDSTWVPSPFTYVITTKG